MIQKWKSIATGFALSAAMTVQSFHPTALQLCTNQAANVAASASAAKAAASASAAKAAEAVKTGAQAGVTADLKKATGEAQKPIGPTQATSEATASTTAATESTEATAPTKASWFSAVTSLPGNMAARVTSVAQVSMLRARKMVYGEQAEAKAQESTNNDRFAGAKAWFTAKTVGGAATLTGLAAAGYYYKDQLHEMINGKEELPAPTWKGHLTLKNAGIAAALAVFFGLGVYKYATQIQTLEELLNAYVFNTTETDAEAVVKNVTEAAEYYGFTSEEDKAVIMAALQEAGFVNTL